MEWGMRFIPYPIPRAEIFKQFCKAACMWRKAMRQNMHCMRKVEQMAPEIIGERA